MARNGDASLSMAMEGRIASAYMAAGVPFEFWGGSSSYPVGGHFVYVPIDAAHAAKVVLDTSMDWRDRIWTISGILYKNNAHSANGLLAHEVNTTPPGVSGVKYGWRGDIFASGGGWDGSGVLGGAPKFCYLQPYDLHNEAALSLFWIYADSLNNGALTIRNETLSHITGILTILVSEQSGRIASIV